jgi:hypothetical protein
MCDVRDIPGAVLSQVLQAAVIRRAHGTLEMIGFGGLAVIAWLMMLKPF